MGVFRHYGTDLRARPGSEAAVVTRDLGITLVAANIESVDLDVDLDGAIDFTFTAAFVDDPVLTVGFAVVDFPFGSGNGVVIDEATGNGFPNVSRLGIGATISAASRFSLASFDQGNLSFITSFDPPTGNFAGRQGFIGLRFDSAGGTRFGFAEVAVNGRDHAIDPFGVTLKRVAFNDASGAPLTTVGVPAPAGLGLLGLAGAALALSARRRRAVPLRAAALRAVAGFG